MERPTIRILGFRTAYIKKAGSADLVARDYVKYAPVHDINAVTEEIVTSLRPPENGLERDDEGLKMGYMQALWGQIEPHYKAWKEGSEIPEHGIPLSAWAGVTAEQAEVMRRQGVRTVEDAAAMTEGQMGKVMLPGIRNIKTMAAEYLASRKDTETASKVADLAEQNAALKAQLEHMASMIAAMREEVPALEPAKRRGRPPKSEVEEAA